MSEQITEQIRQEISTALDKSDTQAISELPVITDLGLLEPDPATRELMVTAIHPGVARAEIEANTGWPVRFAAEVATTPAPRPEELAALRDLRARTAAAHGRPSGE